MRVRDYLASYFEALAANAFFGGLLFFAYSLYARNSMVADYTLYVCAVAALGGPIGLLINRRNIK